MANTVWMYLFGRARHSYLLKYLCRGHICFVHQLIHGASQVHTACGGHQHRRRHILQMNKHSVLTRDVLGQVFSFK